MAIPTLMPTTKRAKSPKAAKRFSLVPADAQYEMVRALAALKSSRSRLASGSEVAEIAVCLAAGEPCPVVLACAGRGARCVCQNSRLFEVKGSGVSKRRLAAATLAAMDALLHAAARDATSPSDSLATPAVVCAGGLESDPEAEQDYRAAFRFAARHKLPILYVVANSLAPSQSRPLDLRTLYPEFGIPLFSVDANDAIAAYRVATEALHNARHLRGPCVIEALAVPQPPSGAASPLELLASYMERHGNPPPAELN
ncbi:MAG: thiamine pyrophosphate-dependent enzyme [Candidatus Korobacteraceae bacterium]